MTLLSVVRDVCMTIGVTAPTSVFSGITGNRTLQELLALANEMAQRIAWDSRDWQALRVGNNFVGDGVTTDFPLPQNFKRLLLTSNVWRGSNLSPMKFIADHDEWLRNGRSNQLYSSVGGGSWMLTGGKMRIMPVLAVAEVAGFAYLDKNCIDLASGGRSDSFLSDLDSFVLDERLLKLGMIWQWKASKGASYAEDMATYNDAMDYAKGHDTPAPIIVGRRAISDGVTVAYPW